MSIQACPALKAPGPPARNTARGTPKRCQRKQNVQAINPTSHTTILSFLAEQMLEMNKQKQQEIKGLLGWLETEMGAKVEDLSPKTKVQEYYKLQFDELLAVLKKNKRKLKDYDPARREPQERLRLEFDASVGKLQPLMERITATDELIDQIVYKLYGLTEEKIAIVEGKSAR
jgi:hypothetical protein